MPSISKHVSCYLSCNPERRRILPSHHVVMGMVPAGPFIKWGGGKNLEIHPDALSCRRCLGEERVKVLVRDPLQIAWIDNMSDPYHKHSLPIEWMAQNIVTTRVFCY